MKRTEIRFKALDRLTIVGAAILAVAILSVPALAQSEECASPTSPAVFDNDWIRATASDGWVACKSNNTQSGPRKQLTESLFQKDDFKLYLITHTDHASPVDGGRFVEVARYVSPWIDMDEARCGFFMPSATTKVSPSLSRVDFYFDAAHADKDALEVCGNPESKAVFWYGSYFAENCPPRRRIPTTDECGGYYIGYPRVAGGRPKSGSGPGMMIFSLTFDTKDPDYLPERGNPDLNNILNEATAIVRQIRYK